MANRPSASVLAERTSPVATLTTATVALGTGRASGSRTRPRMAPVEVSCAASGERERQSASRIAGRSRRRRRMSPTWSGMGLGRGGETGAVVASGGFAGCVGAHRGVCAFYGKCQKGKTRGETNWNRAGGTISPGAGAIAAAFPCQFPGNGEQEFFLPGTPDDLHADGQAFRGLCDRHYSGRIAQQIEPLGIAPGIEIFHGLAV